jgi:hypothetical protein
MEKQAYLNCPKCPAQAFPEGNACVNGTLQLYKCPAGHQFYIEPEKESNAGPEPMHISRTF